MIGPRKKRSIAQKHSQNATWQRRSLKKLSNMTAYTRCTNCGTHKLSHRVCPECGFHRWEHILTIKEKSKDKVVEA